MRIFYDTEFIEDGRTIDLISIGMVAEDGREYYAVNRDMPVKRIAKHDWLMRNVVPKLPRLYGDARNFTGCGGRWNPLCLAWSNEAIKPHANIADEVRRFIGATQSPELWAWYGAYDHVVLAQLWGPMIALPSPVPMWTNDVRQEMARLGDPVMPEQERGAHNALEDARHVKAMFDALSVIGGANTVNEGEQR